MKIRKFNLRKIVTIILVVFIFAGCVAGLVALGRNKNKKISASSFSVGELDEQTGSYVSSKTAIYTKGLIECQGLKIVPDFDAELSYQVFYYNYDEIYIGCTPVYEGKTYNEEVPSLAKYCRIVAYPEQVDNDGNPDSNFKVNVFNKTKYANKLTVTVDKKQSYEPVNLHDAVVYEVKDSESIDTSDVLKQATTYGSVLIKGHSRTIAESESGYVLGFSANSTKDTLIVDVSKIDKLYLENPSSPFANVYMYDEQLTSSGYLRLDSGDTVITSSLIGVKYVIIQVNNDQEFTVNVYTPKNVGVIYK